MTRILLHIVFLVSLIFLFDNCGYTKLVKTGSTSSNIDVHLPDPFEVIYKVGNNELNSVEEYVKKDLVRDGYAIAFYQLTNEEKIRIYNVVKDIDWSTYPDRIGTSIELITNSLWIKYGDIEESISWSSFRNLNDDQKLAIQNMEEVLNDILFNSSAYRSLPPSSGGRL